LCKNKFNTYSTRVGFYSWRVQVLPHPLEIREGTAMQLKCGILDTDSVPVLPERVWIICIKKATSFENPNT
jgi:hypothetical protein